MSSSPWAAEYNDHYQPHRREDEGFEDGERNAGTSSPPVRRKRLELKPRSAKGSTTHSASSHKSSSNPFGAAKPREEVLAKKGIDSKLMDARIQKKAEVLHLTKEQEKEADALREELTSIENSLREANEKELPEEKYRVAAEEKRKELNDLIKKFSELNTQKETKTPSPQHGGRQQAHNNRPKFERPSERRKRLEQQGGSGRHKKETGEDDDEAFSSFGGRRHHGGGGGGGKRDY